MILNGLELAFITVGGFFLCFLLVALFVHLIRKCLRQVHRRKSMVTQKDITTFSEGAVGQAEETYEDMKQLMKETRNMSTSEPLWPRSSITDSLSIARTESNQSRKASMDSGIAGSIGIGSVSADLYQRRGTIIRRESNPHVTTCGTVHCKLLYIFKRSELLVKIEEVANIPATIMSIFPSKKQLNPFVTVDIFPPVDVKIRQSSVRKNSLSPVIGETFSFFVEYQDLYTHSLIFTIFDFNDCDQSKQKFGKARIALDEVDHSMEVEVWLDIVAIELERRKTTGQLLLSLNYLPSVGRLTLVIMNAKELQLTKTMKDDLDYLVRVIQVKDDKVIKRKKTTAHKFDNLVWNEAMFFKLAQDNHDDVHFDVQLVERESRQLERLIGDFTLGKYSTSPSGKEHWGEVICESKETCTMWHNIQRDL